MKKETIIYAYLLVILLSISLHASTSAACITNSECDDAKICTQDKCLPSLQCPANCPGMNCSGCINVSSCAHLNVSDCEAKRYIQIGQGFNLGSGACETRHIFNGQIGKTSIQIDAKTASYNGTGNTTSGYVVNFRDDATRMWYVLRYNNISKLLYLEEFPKCLLTTTCTSTRQCDDHNPCTFDDCDGIPARCRHKRIGYCKDNDGCCPRYNELCSYKNDRDCYECNAAIDCDDANSSTEDSCDTYSKLCSHLPIQLCKDHDQQCPEGCNYAHDKDCTAPALCGNKQCEPLEQCCIDCGCPSGYLCNKQRCIKAPATLAKEIAENSSLLQEKRSNLTAHGYLFSNESIQSKEQYFVLIQQYQGKKYHATLTATVYLNGSISQIDVTEKKNINPWPVIFIVVGLIALLFLGGIIMKWFEQKPKNLNFVGPPQSNYDNKKSS